MFDSLLGRIHSLLAQLVEQHSDEVKVMGSTPVEITIRKGGRVWFITIVLKTIGCQSSVSSNLTPSSYESLCRGGS